jgi:thymidylate synthase (FAD)
LAREKKKEMLIETPVLDHGFVRLDDCMGDDLSVVNAARVSFAVRHESMKEGDDKLIKFLMTNRHGTPFEHNAFRFHVAAPIFVFREWHRHRIGSFNEVSGRYKKFENPNFYIPRDEDFRTQTGKPGAYTFEQWKGNTKQARATMLRHCQDAFDLYEWYVAAGMAKEQARIVLPLNLYSEHYWTVNARSLMNFLSLRNSEAAMWEIRQYAQVLEALWATEMPVTHKAFIDNGRVAP